MIEVTDCNIKFFECVVKKHNVDFAIKKDKMTDPPGKSASNRRKVIE